MIQQLLQHPSLNSVACSCASVTFSAAPGYWKGNRAGGGAALLTSVTSNADKVWVVYLQA